MGVRNCAELGENLKTIVKENNLDVFFRYKRYFT